MKKITRFLPDPKNSNKQEVCNRTVTYRPKKLRYFVKILWLSQNIRTLTLKKKYKLQFLFFIFKIVVFFFQKLGSEEPNSGLHRLVPTLDNVHLHLAKVQSLN